MTQPARHPGDRGRGDYAHRMPIAEQLLRPLRGQRSGPAALVVDPSPEPEIPLLLVLADDPFDVLVRGRLPTACRSGPKRGGLRQRRSGPRPRSRRRARAPACPHRARRTWRTRSPCPGPASTPPVRAPPWCWGRAPPLPGGRTLRTSGPGGRPRATRSPSGRAGPSRALAPAHGPRGVPPRCGPPPSSSRTQSP